MLNKITCPNHIADLFDPKGDSTTFQVLYSGTTSIEFGTIRTGGTLSAPHALVTLDTLGFGFPPLKECKMWSTNQLICLSSNMNFVNYFEANIVGSYLTQVKFNGGITAIEGSTSITVNFQMQSGDSWFSMNFDNQKVLYSEGSSSTEVVLELTSPDIIIGVARVQSTSHWIVYRNRATSSGLYIAQPPISNLIPATTAQFANPEYYLPTGESILKGF